MRTLFLIITFGALLLIAAEWRGLRRSTPPDGSVAREDARLLEEVALGHLLELELGALATRQKTDPALQRQGEALLEEHRRGLEEVRFLAAAKGIVLPAEPSADQRRLLAPLQRRKGSAPLRKLGIEKQQEVMALYQRTAKEARDPEIRELARSALEPMREALALWRGSRPEAVGERR